MKFNFNKTSAEVTNAFGVPYDYMSIVHYSSKAFSKNGQPTIVANVSAERFPVFFLHVVSQNSTIYFQNLIFIFFNFFLKFSSAIKIFQTGT